ncbi:hypothetical protein PUW24_16260 [Paenibacillus urinalis]|uniref:Uncharacterized protein n=1 Tax=Paenibacillus urinalis TaxID=521520 RepID=A0ABY7XDS8_9BACL|nr:MULTISPECIES: hypothetical protein [Paenibacillus]WDH95754.1 hypothetical protein PUW24_16260 [Paenibacillus urinalis]WDI03951.1 hypothetical protein PUW25_08380 [Paenibacillus urinalis]
MASNTAASNVNRDVLVGQLGLRQYKNTTIYTKSRVFVISPSSQNSYSWFDLRKVNLDRYDRTKETGHLLVRYQNILLWAELNQFIDNSISEESKVYTPSIGVHWKFNIVEHDGNYTALNRTGKQKYKLINIGVEKLKSIIES